MRLNNPRFLVSPATVKHGLRLGALLGVPFALRAAFAASQSLRVKGYSVGNPWVIGATVFVGACLAGGLIGALRPLARRLPIAIALGCLSVFLVVVTLDVIRNRVTYPPSAMDWGIDVATSLVLGTIGTLVVRSASRSGRTA